MTVTSEGSSRAPSLTRYHRPPALARPPLHPHSAFAGLFGGAAAAAVARSVTAFAGPTFQAEATVAVFGLAAGDIDEATFAAWLRDRTAPR